MEEERLPPYPSPPAWTQMPLDIMRKPYSHARQIVLALPSIPRKFDSRWMSGDSPFTPRILMGAYSWVHTGLVVGMQPCIYTVCMDTRYCGPHGGPILGLVVGPRGPLHTHSG